MNSMRLVVVFLVALTVISCKNQEDDVIKTTATKFISLEDQENQYRIKNHEYIFGDTEEYPLAMISGLSVIKNGLIYIFDSSLNQIYAIQNDGTLFHSFKLKEGKGPGEFVRAFSFEAGEDHIYIYDRSLFRLTVFDHDFNLLNEFTDQSTTLNLIMQPLENGKVLAARNLLRIKPDEFTCFVFDGNSGEILHEFDQSYEIVAKTHKENVQLNTIAMPVYDGERYFLLMSLPFILKEYDNNGKLIRIYRLKDRDNPYFERGEFIIPTYANIGFSYDEYYDLFLVNIANNRERNSKLYLFNSDFELKAVINMNEYGIDEDDLFQLSTSSSDHKGNIYLLSNSREGPKILKITLENV